MTLCRFSIYYAILNTIIKYDHINIPKNEYIHPYDLLQPIENNI